MTNTKTTKPVKIIEGASAIDAAIKSIANRGKKLDRDIQQAAISAMAHHSKHGDVTLVNRLVDAMPKGSRVNALRDFILNHGAVSYDEESKKFVHAKGKEARIEAAQGIMWTEFKPEPEYQPFDAMAALNSLLARVQKADSLKGDKVPEGFSAKLEALKAELTQPDF